MSKHGQGAAWWGWLALIVLATGIVALVTAFVMVAWDGANLPGALAAAGAVAVFVGLVTGGIAANMDE